MYHCSQEDGMDNWIAFILVNVVLVIVLNIFTDMLSPWVKSFYDKTLFMSKQKRIEALIFEYRVFENYRKDLILLMLIVLRGIVFSLMMAVLAIVTSVATVASLLLVELRVNFPRSGTSSAWDLFKPEHPIIVYLYVFLAGVFFLGCLYICYRLVIYPINTVMQMNTFKRKTKSKLTKLGGNPEELDKIDKEVNEKRKN
jgi:hypothetical protein